MSCGRRDHFLDERLDEAERAAFVRHVAECAACAEACRAWQDDRARLRTWAEGRVVDPPPVARVIARVQARQRTRRVARGAAATLGVALVGGALAAAGAFGPLYTGRPPAPAAAELAAAVAPTTPPPAAAAARALDVDVVARAGDTTGGAGGVLETGVGRMVARLDDDVLGLDERTRLRVARAIPGESRLVLDRGTVAAQVAHRHPGERFVVEAGDVEVAAIGTRFAVARDTIGVRVTVTEGRVWVTSPDGVDQVDAGHALWLGPEIHPDERARATTPEDATWLAALVDVGHGTDGPATPRHDHGGPLAGATARSASAGPAAASFSAPVSAVVSHPGEASAAAPALPTLAELRRRVAEGDLDGARGGLHERVDAAPTDAEAWFLLGAVERKAGELDVAVAAWEAAARGEPGIAARARYDAAVALQDAGRDEEALGWLDALLTLGAGGRDADVRLRRAEALVRLGRREEAVAALTEVITRHPGTSVAARALVLLGDEP